MILFLITGLFFIAVLLGLIAASQWYTSVRSSPSYMLKKRLKRFALEDSEQLPADLKIEILAETTAIDKFFYKLRLAKKLDALIESAGLKMDLKTLLLIVLLAAFTGVVAGIGLRRGILPPIVLSIAFTAMPIIYLTTKKQQRLLKFNEQFPDALDIISRSLRAGHSFSSAVEVVRTEMSDPMAVVFRNFHEEQRLGISLKDALEHMIYQMDNPDLRFFGSAIAVHLDIGGNLSEVLEKLAQTIRERLKLRRQIRVYSAQARLSGYVLGVLPIFVGVFFYLTTPGYIEELFISEIGKYAVTFAAIAQIIGFLVIRKLINIRI